MLTSLNPIGERARQQPWAITVVAFTVGSILGGLAVGGVLGTLGAVVPTGTATTRLVVVVIAMLAAVVADAVGPPPPGLQRQVDRTWMTRYRGWVYGLGYGLQLGTGITTYVTSWTTWLLLVTMVVLGATTPAAVIGAVFGLVRAISLWTTAGVTTPAQLRARHRRLVAAHPAVRRAGAVLMAGLAVVAAATVVLA